MTRETRLRHRCPHRLLLFAVTVGAVALSSSCGDDSSEGDPVLGQGQQVYADACAECHGPDRGGGAGPPLDAAASADIDEEIELISSGRGGMPGFEDRLTREQIEAVARYLRSE